MRFRSIRARLRFRCSCVTAARRRDAELRRNDGKGRGYGGEGCGYGGVWAVAIGGVVEVWYERRRWLDASHPPPSLPPKRGEG